MELSCLPPRSPLSFGALSPFPAHVCLLLGPSQNGRGLRAEVGQSPVGPAGLRRERQLEWKHEGPVGGWCRAQVVVSIPGCWNDLERDFPPCPGPVGSPSWVTLLARLPFLTTSGKRAEIGREVCALSRGGRVIVNVGVVSAVSKALSCLQIAF